MRIMMIGGGFAPAKKYGGPVVSMVNLCNFDTTSEYYVVARNHDWKNEEKLVGIHSGWNVFNDNTKVLYLGDDEHTVGRYKDIVSEINPDLIYINGFYLAHMYLPAIVAAQNKKVPLLIAPRGTLNKNAMAIKSAKKYAYCLFMRCLLKKERTFFQSTSDEETDRIHSLLGIKPSKIYVVENVPTIPNAVVNAVKKERGIVRCCFFARICKKKNLLGALEALQGCKENVVFNIYGNIEDSEYWKLCERKIGEMPSNVSVYYKGEYDHDSVFDLMKDNHVFLFPTFSENYGHVIVEALLADLPVIISDQTPWNGVYANGAGYALPLKETGAFTTAVDNYALMDSEEFEKQRKNVHKYVRCALKLEELKNKYKSMYSNVIEPSDKGF